MTVLERAVLAADARKRSQTGDIDGFVRGSEEQDRAVFSGFDIQYDELVGTSGAIADLYTMHARIIGLRALFVSCWCDGLLTGMLAASLPPAAPNGSSVTDDTGPLGGD